MKYKQDPLDVIRQSLCDSIAVKGEYDKAVNIIDALGNEGYYIEDTDRLTVRDRIAMDCLNTEITSFNNMSESHIIRYRRYLRNKWGNIDFNDLLSREAYEQADSMIKIR